MDDDRKDEVASAFSRLLETGVASETPDGASLNFQSATARLLELNPYDLSLTLPALRTIIEFAPAATAGPTALMVGAAIENGFSPESGVGVVLPGLKRALSAANEFRVDCETLSKNNTDVNEEELAPWEIIEQYSSIAKERFAVEGAYFENMRGFCLSTIAGLSRSKQLRQSFENREPLVVQAKALALIADGAGFLSDMLLVLDDEPLVVLHPESGLGFRFTMSGIADNFQLHTLLGDALLREWPEGRIPGRRPHPKVIAASIDADVDETHSGAHGCFDLYNWPILNRAGFLPSKKKDKEVGFHQFRISRFIWGEGLPADIAVFEGQRVVIACEPSVERGWNAGRRFAELKPELLLEEVFTRVQVRKLLEAMGTKAAEQHKADPVTSKFYDL